MKLYKLTDANNCAYNQTDWTQPQPIKPTVNEPKLCSSDVYHAYTSPLLAELMNPAHANFSSTKKLWECDGEPVVNNGLKVGCYSLTNFKQIDVPIITKIQRIAFGILSVLEIEKEVHFVNWANNWLNRVDRTYQSAINAAANSANAANAAAVYDTAAAVYDTVFNAVNAAAAAATAAHATNTIDFEKIAKKAMEYC